MATKFAISLAHQGTASVIALFLPSLDAGGAERSMVTVANGLAARGHCVDLVLASATGPFLASIGPGVQLIDLKQPRVSRSLRGLVHYIRTRRPAVVLSAMSHSNVIAIAAAKLAGMRTRVVVCEQASLRGRLAHEPLKDRVTVLCASVAYPLAEAVVTVAEAMTAEFGAKAIAIPNPVDCAGAAAQGREPMRNARDQGSFILAAGRLVPQKDFSTLIRAFARLEPPLRLVILGDGPERAALEQLAGEVGVASRVHLPGFDPNPFAWMARAKVFVLSSRYEGLPGVLIQAMACGCPVVATDCPTGPREILSGGRWGDLIPMSAPSAMADAIRAALARDVHPDVKRRASDYDIGPIVDRYVGVLLPEAV